MFNLRYNILAIYNVILAGLSSVLLIRVLGVSAKADAFLIASNIIASLQFIQIMFVEQFMFFYNDLKVEDRQGAREFYHAAVTFSLLSGILFCLAYLLAVHPLIRIFAFGIDGERYELLRNVLQIMFIGVVFDSANLVNQRLLNAEMKFSAPYILNSFQTLFTVLLLVYLTLSHNANVELIAYARTLGTCIACLAGFVMLGRMGFPLRFRLRHPALGSFVRNSLSMRFGLNIHNILLNPITNNILSLLPSGFASYYYYAQRLHQVVGNVVIGPSYAVFQSRVSRLWSEQNLSGIKADIRKFLPSTVIVFMGAVTLMFFLIPAALELVSSRNLASGDIRHIQLLFLAMAPWYLVALVESPFLSVNIASKRSIVFIACNTMFILTYFLLSLLLVQRFGLYTIPIAMTSAQMINLVTFTSFCLALLKGNGKTTAVVCEG